MRKYISIIILNIILFNIGGYYIWFGVMQYNLHQEIKQEIKKDLNEKDLILIEISDNSTTLVNWKEIDKEFEYKGEMYDVVKIKKSKNKTQYYCINDCKEEQLIADFKKNHNSCKETDKRIKTVFNFQYFPQEFATEIFKKTTIISYPDLINLYNSNTPDIHSPPPKSV